MPSPGPHGSLGGLIPADEPSLSGSLESADSIYSYPELEDDMASIFDLTSSLNWSGNEILPSQVNCDLSCSADLHEIEVALECKAQQPPSSVIRDHNRVSPSPEEFDPALQYSPPDINEHSPAAHTTLEEDPLDESVDWDQVMRNVEPSAKTISSFASSFAAASSRSAQKYYVQNTIESTTVKVPPRPTTSVPQHVTPSKAMLLRPFKTFFKIQDMLDQKASLFKNQPGAIFELFARVSYTSRNRTGCSQYFQLCDLSSQGPPFLSGALTN